MTTTAAASNPYRLPYSVEPTTYRLTLAPDLEAASFTGTVDIEVRVHDDVDHVVLNAIELELTDAVVLTPDGRTSTATWTYDTTYERVTLSLPEPLSIGEATIRLAFTGILNDQLHGFYRSSFTDAEGTTHTIATSQMEATDARRAFPCFDEPDRKATFEITLVVDEHLAAYSNSPVVHEHTEAGKRTVVFGPTMKMSTYLVAFVVGPFESTDPVDVDGIELRVISPKGKGHLGTFALDIGAFSLRFFSQYFDIPYPGDKLDLIAIPDFAFGAMENLGCVTFRETALLVDPERASRAEMERIVDVVAHEIAHMWFGDLVTMGWWEGIWLNEAFATFMEIMCTDAFKPSWQRWVSFGLEKEMALSVDGLHSTRPIEFEVISPDDANGMFDVLTYQKGGSVLRMLEQYLGAETFRNGIRLYLKRHSYANTVTSDLWDAIEESSGQPVRSIMDSWILQGGHPLVTLDGATISQQPFAYGPLRQGETSKIGHDFKVPVLARSLADGAETKILLGAQPVTVELAAPVVINAGGSGVYRTAYAAPEAAAIASQLGSLSPLERATVLNDAWAATLASKMELSSFFGLAASLGDDDEPATWLAVTRALAFLNRVVEANDRPALEALTQRLLGPKASSLGWEAQAGESERTPGLRAALLQSLGTIGADRAVIATALETFDGGVAIDPNLLPSVLDIVASQGREGDYERFLAQYRSADTPQLEVTYLMALAGFGSEAHARATFELARTEVRTQNAPFLVSSCLANRTAGALTWTLVQAHYVELLERFPANSHSRMLSGIALLFSDPAVAATVRPFLEANPIATGHQTVIQALERLDNAVGFAAKIAPNLAATLSSQLG